MSNGSSIDADGSGFSVLCIGFGALGAVYGHILSRGGARVTAVARSNYDAIVRDGITLTSPLVGGEVRWRPHRLVRSADEVQDESFDYVLCTFKCTPDVRPTSQVLAPFLAPPATPATPAHNRLPTIVTVQNGVGIEDELRASLVDAPEPRARAIITAVAWIGANLKDNGTRVEYGQLVSEKLEMGVFPRRDAPTNESGVRLASSDESSMLSRFFSAYHAGGGGGMVSEDMEAVRWKKVLWNASWGGLCALARQPVSALLRESTLHVSVGVVRRIMLEVLYVARACGVNEARFPASAIDNAFYITAAGALVPQFQPARSADTPATRRPTVSNNFKPSILLDLEAGRPMELYPIIGAIVQRARAHNVDTPRLDLILAALWPNQVDAIQAARNDTDDQAPIGTQYSSLAAASKGAWLAGAPVPERAETFI